MTQNSALVTTAQFTAKVIRFHVNYCAFSGTDFPRNLHFSYVGITSDEFFPFKVFTRNSVGLENIPHPTMSASCELNNGVDFQF